MVHGGTSIHESLSYSWQTGVNYVRLVNVEHKFWILYDVHPESQGQTEETKILEWKPSGSIKL